MKKERFYLNSQTSYPTYRDFLRKQRQKNRIRRNYSCKGKYFHRFLTPKGNTRAVMKDRAGLLILH